MIMEALPAPPAECLLVVEQQQLGRAIKIEVRVDQPAFDGVRAETRPACPRLGGQEQPQCIFDNLAQRHAAFRGDAAGVREACVMTAGFLGRPVTLAVQ